MWHCNSRCTEWNCVYYLMSVMNCWCIAGGSNMHAFGLGYSTLSERTLPTYLQGTTNMQGHWMTPVLVLSHLSFAQCKQILRELFPFDDDGTGNMIKSSLSLCFCLAHARPRARTIPSSYRRPHKLWNEFAIILPARSSTVHPAYDDNNNLSERNVLFGGDWVVKSLLKTFTQ